MQSQILSLLPSLKSFNYESHYETLFINQDWVLVNGISDEKSIYTFKDENTLMITQNNSTSETSWCIDFKNTFSIQTKDGLNIFKAYFKGQDILVLDREKHNDYAVFLNQSNYNNEINTLDDVSDFLKQQYKAKASQIISGHQFYYIEDSEEFGPFTAEELTNKVTNEAVSEYCFIRDINEDDYHRRLRISDLLKEL